MISIQIISKSVITTCFYKWTQWSNVCINGLADPSISFVEYIAFVDFIGGVDAKLSEFLKNEISVFPLIIIVECKAIIYFKSVLPNKSHKRGRAQFLILSLEAWSDFVVIPCLLKVFPVDTSVSFKL